MFRLSSEPLTVQGLDAESAGGFVAFEGKVRDHADGRQVRRLEYEAFAEMAVAEGEKLVAEAAESFGLAAARVVHRTGILEVGETAVVIEVAAPHRREAFAACEWIIDQLKFRVPIWKKEHYADGDSGWVGSGHVGPTVVGNPELTSRQARLPFVGEEGQRRLSEARVLLVGVGGLGATALPYLVGAGICHLGIIDHDVVEVSNLHRQILYSVMEIGRSKAERAAAFARRLNPAADVHHWPVALDSDNVDTLIADYDWIIDGTDSLRVKFLLNAAVKRHGKHLVTASVHQMEGQVMTVSPDGPCLQCLFPETPPEGCVETCAEVGILGVVPGWFGILQATEVLKAILGLPDRLDHDMLLGDLRHGLTTRIARSSDPACPVCQGRSAAAPVEGLEVSSLAAATERFGAFVVVDIRELYETPECPVAHLRVPGSQLDPGMFSEPVVLVCASGARSYRLASDLLARGVENVVSLAGGVTGLVCDDT